MFCRLCDSPTTEIFRNLILNKFEINFYQCPACKLIQTEKPYWLPEAYEKSISITDTGILERNHRLSKIVLTFLTSQESDFGSYFLALLKSFFFRPKPFQGTLLDIGGGYGILVRLLRDLGIDADWSDKYSENIFAVGFERSFSENYQVITAFEFLEHLENPKIEIQSIIHTFKPDYFLFSTSIYGEAIPDLDWWYYSFETGQHIAFYSLETLHFIEKLIGYKLYQLSSDTFVFYKNLKNRPKGIKRIIKSKLFFDIAKKVYISKTFPDHLQMKESLKISKL